MAKGNRSNQPPSETAETPTSAPSPSEPVTTNAEATQEQTAEPVKVNAPVVLEEKKPESTERVLVNYTTKNGIEYKNITPNFKELLEKSDN